MDGAARALKRGTLGKVHGGLFLGALGWGFREVGGDFRDRLGIERRLAAGGRDALAADPVDGEDRDIGSVRGDGIKDAV